MISGCSLNEIQRIKPPDVLLQDCYKPSFTGKTYRDLVLHSVDLGNAIDLCNSDKEALRKWVAEEEK